MATRLVTVPDGKYCNDQLICRLLIHSTNDPKLRPRCAESGSVLDFEADDSAYVLKDDRCRRETG